MEKVEFTCDIAPYPDEVSAVILRSPVAKGILAEIQTPRLPGGVSLVRAEHIPGKNRIELPENASGEGWSGFPVLAEKELSYIGEPLALLTGPDRSALMEFAAGCTVVTAESAPVFDYLSSQNNAAERLIRFGDTKAAFNNMEKTGKIVEGTYTTAFQDAWASDTNGAVAIPHYKDASLESITVRTATQWPYHVVSSVARILGIDQAKVEIIPSRLEPALDSRLIFPSFFACLAALAAFKTGKPVRLILDRAEDFRFSPKRIKTHIKLRSALGKDGRILATEASIRADMGAYPCWTNEVLDRIILGALGAYHHGDLLIDAKAVLTNVPPAGPLAGFGLAQGFFAMERHASRIADELREDPSEWRKNVFLQRGTRLAIGGELREQVQLESLVDTASMMSDYRRKWASFELLRQRRREEGRAEGEPLRGIGIATAFQGNGFIYPLNTKMGVEVTLEKDLSLEIKTGMAGGEDRIFPWRAIAERELGVENVKVTMPGNSDSGPSCLSRNISLVTRLVERCCEAIKKQRFRDPLPITVRRYYNPSRSGAWGSKEKTFDENTFSGMAWAAAVVQAEIDPVEYRPRVTGVWLAVDGGPILAEERARKNLTLFSVQALNWTSGEALSYENGIIPEEQIRSPLFRMEDQPPIKIDFQWSEGAPKGIGELPWGALPPAYTQALSQAADHPFENLPIEPAEIWKALQRKKETAEAE